MSCGGRCAGSRKSPAHRAAPLPPANGRDHAGQAGQAPWALKWNDRSSLGSMCLTSGSLHVGQGKGKRRSVWRRPSSWKVANRVNKLCNKMLPSVYSDNERFTERIKSV